VQKVARNEKSCSKYAYQGAKKFAEQLMKSPSNINLCSLRLKTSSKSW